MNDFVLLLNRAGDAATAFAGPAFLQSAVLIAVVGLLDRLLHRRATAAVRATLWLLVLVKLALPPSLALPTGVGYWLNRPAQPAPAAAVMLAPADLLQSDAASRPPMMPAAPPARPAPRLRVEAWLLLAWAAGALVLADLTLVQWLRVRRPVRDARPAPPELAARLEHAATRLGLRRAVRLRLADSPHGPLVFGLFRPVILLPERLAAGLDADQLDDVLLHELAHVRRGDLWTGHAQAILQCLWWWHPLVWLAGRRLDRAREEAADEAVLAALDREPPRYAETLVAVARLVTARPGLTLGFLGILERRSALRRRVERLLDGPAPRRRLGWGTALLLAAFAAAALPMAPGPAQPAASRPDLAAANGGRAWPDPRFPGYAEVRWEAAFYIADEAAVRSVLGDGVFTTPQLLDAAEAPQLAATLLRLGARPHLSARPFGITKMGGGRFHWRVGGPPTNNSSVVSYLVREQDGFRTVVGAEVLLPADAPDWTPVEATITTWSRDGTATELEACEIEFRTGDGPPRSARSPLPPRSALVWAGRDGVPPGRCQLLVIQEESEVRDQERPEQVAPAPVPLIQADGRDVSAEELQRALRHGLPPTGTNAVPVLRDIPVPGLLFTATHENGRTDQPLLGKQERAVEQARERLEALGSAGQGAATEEFVGAKRQLENDRIMLDVLQRTLAQETYDAALRQEAAASPSPEADQEAAAGGIAAKLAEARAELAALRTRYRDRWPAVVAQEARVAELERQLADGRPDVLEITVTEGSRPYVVNGQPLDRTGLVQALARRPHGPPDSVRFLADSGVPAGTLVRAISAAREASVTRVTVAPPAESPAKAAEPPPGSSSVAGPGASLDPAALGRLGTVTLEPPPVVAGRSVLAAGTLANIPPAAAGTPATNALFTRFFRLSPHLLADNLRGSGVPAAAAATNLTDAVNAYLAAAGLEFLPPKAMYFNERMSTLMVRTSSEDMEVVMHAVETVNLPTPMVQLEVQGLRVGDEHAAALLAGRDFAVLPEAQVRELRRVMPAGPRAAVADGMQPPRVTTLSGRGAEFEVGGPGEARLTVLPWVAGDQVTITLDVSATLDGRPAARVAAHLWDGQTLLLRLGAPASETGAYVLVAPLLVDPAGNAVNQWQPELKDRPPPGAPRR